MEATEQERQWALALKRAATTDPTIDETQMTDWEFLQHAICAKSNVSKALVRMKHLQALKERYGILGDGSVEAAARDLAAFQIRHPGYMLSMAQLQTISQQPATPAATSTSECQKASVADSSCRKPIDPDESSSTDESDNYNDKNNDNRFSSSFSHTMLCCAPHVMCTDYSKALRNRNKSDEGFAIRFRALFYLLQAMNANPLAMRSGFAMLLDTKDMSWRNFDLEKEHRNIPLYSGLYYPARTRHLLVLNASPLVRCFFSVVRLLMKPKIRQRTRIVSNAHQWLAETRNDPLFGYDESVLPTSWGGKVDETEFQETILAKLRERYKNARTFRL